MHSNTERRGNAMRVVFARAAVLLAAAFTGHAAAQDAVSCPQDPGQFCDVEDLPVAAVPTHLIHAPQYGLLIVNNQNEVLVIDTLSHATTSHVPIAEFATFSDMAISPSGRYVFAADWGGDNFVTFPNGPTPSPNYIHRLDLSTRSWEDPELSYEGGKVQAVSDDQIIVRTRFQFAELLNERWTSGTDTLPLNAPSNALYGPGYSANAYGGELRYEPVSGRVLIGSWGSSSQDIEAYRLSGDDFVTQENTGTYGSAQGYGGTNALATDGSAYYYGRPAVDPLDVTHRLNVFPEWIYAATGDVAFGMNNFYDAHTGQVAGSLGIAANLFSVNAQGTDLWAFDQSAGMLRHFVKDHIFADDLGG